MENKINRHCPKCDKELFYSSSSNFYKAVKANTKCRECDNEEKRKKLRGKKNCRWGGYQGISLRYFNVIKKREEHRNDICNLTIQDLWNQFQKQKELCALTNIKLELPRQTRQGNVGNASLDRIDSSKGYSKDNIQWVHKDINWMKQDFDENYFVNMCNLVSNHTKLDEVTPVDIFIKSNKQVLEGVV